MKLRFIPTSVHGVFDHVLAPALVAGPAILKLGRTSPESVVARAVGGVEALSANFTDYELSRKKIVPMPLHLVLDAVGGATLALVPQLTGARARGKKHWAPHLALGAFEVGLALLTKTEAPKTKAGRAAQLAKLVATAKVAKETTQTAVQAARSAVKAVA